MVLGTPSQFTSLIDPTVVFRIWCVMRDCKKRACTDLSRAVYVAGHDAYLALARLDDAGAVRANKAGLAARLQQALLHAHHILYGACLRINVVSCPSTSLIPPRGEERVSSRGARLASLQEQGNRCGKTHLLRNALRDAHGQRNLGINRLENGCCGKGRRHVDDGGVGPSGGLGLSNNVDKGV